MYEILFNDISVSFNENFYPQAISLHFPIIQNFLKNYKKIFYFFKKKGFIQYLLNDNNI